MIPQFVWTQREKDFLKNNLASMGFKTYLDFLLSEWWMDKREAIIKAKGGICEHCQKRKIQLLHHLTYEHLGNEPLKDIAGLCKPCGKEVHGIE